MKIITKDSFESAHQWIDEKGALQNTLCRALKGAIIDVETDPRFQVGDRDRWLSKLAALNLIEQAPAE